MISEFIMNDNASWSQLMSNCTYTPAIRFMHCCIKICRCLHINTINSLFNHKSSYNYRLISRARVKPVGHSFRRSQDFTVTIIIEFKSNWYLTNEYYWALYKNITKYYWALYKNINKPHRTVKLAKYINILIKVSISFDNIFLLFLLMFFFITTSRSLHSTTVNVNRVKWKKSPTRQ